MILINLLPQEMRPIKRTPLPYLASLCVLALVLLGIAFLYLRGQARLAGEHEKLAEIEAELKTLEAIREDYKRLKAEEERLRAKVKVIQEILQDRIIWSEQLSRLVELTPENVWYDHIWVSLEEEQREVEILDEKTKAPIPDPRTGRNKVEVIKTKEHRLHLSGYAKQDENGVTNLYPLVDNIKADKEFTERFAYRMPQGKDTSFLDQPVRQFTMDFKINPVETEEAAAPVQGASGGGGA